MPAVFRSAMPIALVAMVSSLVVAAGPADANSHLPNRAVEAGQPIGNASNVVPAPTAPHPVAPSVHEFAVDGVSSAGLRQLSTAKATVARGYAALSAPEPATGYAVTGVTWSGSAPAGLSLAIRSRTHGTWSGWTPMQYDAEHGPSPSSQEAKQARPGTDPFVVGNVDDIQLRVMSDSGAAPRQLKLAVIDPGTSSADVSPAGISPEGIPPTDAADVPAAASPTAVTSPVVARGATPMPKIYSRADWGADERLRGCCVEYGEVHAGFVHHTVNANGYRRGEVPAIIRGIYAYHTQTRGWRDVGYNFLIDRFGRIWEGRYGGIGLPIVGAHTLDYNENSFAASAIGNYETTHPNAAMINAYARVYAWKLSLHGVRPKTRQSVAGTTFNAISGHRDAASTACPGRYLYAKIPTIIAKAAQYQHGFSGRELQHSFARDTRPDVLLVKSKGSVAVAQGTGPPGFGRMHASGTDLSGITRVVGVGDVTGDDINDVMARRIKTGSTAIYPGRGDGTFRAPVRATDRWSGTDLFAGAGDVTGDGRDDVLARSTKTGSLLVYAGRDTGRFGQGRVAITDARSFNVVKSAGDFNADGSTDLLSRGKAGAVWIWLGDGAGAFPSKMRVAKNWSAKDLVSAGADVTGDDLPDVVARRAKSGVLSIFANLGGRRLSPSIGRLETNARSLDLSRDVTGDGIPDLVGRSRSEALVVVSGRRQNWVSPPRSASAAWRGLDKVMVVGDWDGDGYVDTMARRRSTGAMWLYRGKADGTFAKPVGGWTGWSRRGAVTPVGDFNGDGRPDLMALSSGHVYLYPGRGTRGVKAPIIMRSSLPSHSTMIGVGLWNGDGAPDVLVRTAGGLMLLYPGNGPGGLDEPRVIGRHFDRYDSVVGVGDLTGDGQADLVGRVPSGQTWLIPGAKTNRKSPGGGFGARQFLAGDWSSYRLG